MRPTPSEAQALVRRLSGASAMPSSIACRSLRIVDRPRPCQTEPPAGRGPPAEDALDELAAARPDQAVKPDDLAFAHRDGDVLEARARQLVGLQHASPEPDLVLVINLLDRATDHQRDQIGLVGLADLAGMPVVYLQRVPEPKTVKNRLHLDLWTTDSAETIERLVALGATCLGSVVLEARVAAGRCCLIRRGTSSAYATSVSLAWRGQ